MNIDLNNFNNFITKEDILKHISDIDVYHKYIDNDIKLNKIMLSPLRNEKKPSFGLFVGETGEICFKDYLLGAGDFVKFVQLKFGLTYFQALSKIAIDFDFADKYVCYKLNKVVYPEKTNLPNREELVKEINSLKLRKTSRNWEYHDKFFWVSFGISSKTLNYYRVEPVSYVHINDKIYKSDKYAYCFTEFKDGIETYKIYQPFNKNYKWLNNHNDSVWQGWEQLPEKGEDLIITKSLKDVMSIVDVTGLSSVSLQTENVIPKESVFNELQSRFETIYLLYDNDYDKDTNWGKQFGERLAEKFNVISIYIPEEYKSKDFSDLVKNHGKVKAKEILFKLLRPF